MLATLKIKKGASVLGAELTESVAVSSLEFDVYLSFIIPIKILKKFRNTTDAKKSIKWINSAIV